MWGALALLLMVLDCRTVWFNRIKQQTSIIVTPLQYVVDAPTSFVRAVRHDVKSQQQLLHENTRLHEKLLFMQAHLQKLLALKKENKQLRALLEAASASPGHFEKASVLAVSPKSYLHNLVIDKGHYDNAYQGQPVLDAHGVMGQITSINQFSSVVSLITDTQSQVPVQDARSGVRAIAQGVGHFNQLSLNYVTQTMDIKQGDQMITSGLGGVYPFGYPVGKVTDIQPDRTSKFMAVSVEPAAHLARSRLVMLFWPKSNHKEAGDDTSNS